MNIKYKHKIAVFTNPHDSVSLLEKHAETWEGYARVSDYVEIDFPKLAQQTIIEAQLGAIDKQETLLRLKFQEKLDEFNSRRANLRAITHEVTPCA